jgi:MEMO1 family protein
MSTRKPSVAGAFYPGDAQETRRQIDSFLNQIEAAPKGRVVGGIAPHAGWMFSGLTAAHLFRALQGQAPPDTVILFGAVHRWPLRAPALYASGAWRTPLGDAQIDEELSRAILDADQGLVDDSGAHDEEHSIEVMVPFVQQIWPEARILPIAMPPERTAPQWGRAVARVAMELDVSTVAVGSTDLTHYGPRYGMAPAGTGQQGLDWAKENDRRVLDLVVQMDAEGVLQEAERRHNACGAGAVAATIGYARELGATQGSLLHYTTSHDAYPMGRPTDLVGYGAVAFVGA